MITAVAERPAMATAKRKGRPKGERDDVTVKMDRGVVAKAKLVAAARGVSLAEYLSDLVRPAVDRSIGQMARKLDKPSGEGE